MLVRRLWLETGIKLLTLVLENEDNAVGDAQKLRRSVPDRSSFFNFQEEFDNVEVGDELLNLAVTTLVHFEDRRHLAQDLLLEDELRPTSSLVVFLY